jgi:fatty-acyl-CoA synthase
MDVARITAPLEYWSARTPHAAALECDGQVLSWGRLHDVAWTWADRFAAAGLRAGDTIGYLTDNGLETVTFILAALAAELVVVPLNVRLAALELADIAADAELSALLVDQAYVGLISATTDRLPAMRLYWKGPQPQKGMTTFSLDIGNAEIGRRSRRQHATGPDVPAFLSYTSGTTGRPKAAVLTHANVMAAARAGVFTDQITSRDTSLVALPLAFTASLMVTWAPVYLAGGCLVLQPRFDAPNVLELLASGRISIFIAVPVVFEALAVLPGFAGTDFAPVRLLRSGGAPATTATLDPYHRRGVLLTLGWAQTESGGVGCATQPSDVADRPLSVGVPMLGLDLKIVDASGNECPEGVVGEVLLRGPSVMTGYWKAPEITAATFPDGWLQTGDLGSVDGDGYLTLAGRSKDMFLSGAINVYPAEIERVIADIPGVAEVAVVGVPDPRWGQVPAAFVVAEPDAALERTAIDDACRVALADYKRPRYVVFQTEPLPRTMSGKIQKGKLDLGLLVVA